MSTCISMIPINALSYAMSRSEFGGNGRHPRGQRPSADSPPVQSVRRRLFGDVDHQQTELDLQNETNQCEERDRRKYNFDFRREQPINSTNPQYEWSQISTDSDLTEDKTDFNVSTNQCQISDLCIAQSSTQSQSATSSTQPEPVPAPPKPATITSIVSSSSSQTPTSVTSAPDSQPQPSCSVEELTPNVKQESKLRARSKQSSLTEFFGRRKSAHNQRKRSAEQVFSHKNRATKRNRLECTSEDSGT